MTPAKPKFSLSTGEITYAARKLFNPDQWMILEELFIPGFQNRVDIWAIGIEVDIHNPYKTRWTAHRFGFEFKSIHAIEVKASRGDFLSELKNPSKRNAAILFSNYYSFAAPRGIIELDEIPEGLGYIEIQGSKPKIIIKPEYTRVEPPDWAFVAAVGRVVGK
jgi:hypothetical protein